MSSWTITNKGSIINRLRLLLLLTEQTLKGIAAKLFKELMKGIPVNSIRV